MDNHTSPQRLNIGLSGTNIVTEAEELRTRLEQRLKQRLSMAQVVKRLIKSALAEEIANSSKS